jgi:hypothetical protein
MKYNYLFGPFVGEAMYELNYFVGHAIYLRKQNPRNRIIVLTREEHFDLYGKYATTLLKLPLSPELIPEGFTCQNMRPTLYEELLRRFELKYADEMKIEEHFYPKITTQLKNIKWYYSRDQVDFNFKPRDINSKIAQDINDGRRDFILSDFHRDIGFKEENHYIFPASYIFQKLDLSKVDQATPLGIIIELIRLSKYVCGDIDSIIGRLAMLIGRPLITDRESIDAQQLNPINPYGSIVIGCKKLAKGIKYLEKLHENNF